MSNNPFATPKDLVEVKLDYLIEDGDFIHVKTKEFLKDEYRKKLKTAKAYFKHENWAAFNQTMKSAINKDAETTIPMLDTIALRDMRLRKLLVKLIDGDGNEVEVNGEFFQDLNPEFGVAIMEAYNEKIQDILIKVFDFTKDVTDIITDEKDLIGSKLPEKENEE